MATTPDTVSMALFCDFENVALGVRDANYEKFDIKPVLERLLLKGSIVVKKAYCDWDRYKGFKATMHEANFELIEIPHVRQSGKNSADIRLVVDALDLCYTKSHVNTFVIISGDSDFSPLVSKLRENAKQVIGVGVKNSTSDLLIANCDEFIFYDDLVREKQRASARRQPSDEQPAPRRAPEEERARREDQERRRLAGVEIAVETFEALVAERGDSGKIWASVLKEAIKRRNPGFSEAAYGFRSFGNLLEEAQALRLLAFGRDEKSGAYVFRHNGPGASAGGSAPSQHPASLQRAEPPAERPPSRYFQQEPAALGHRVGTRKRRARRTRRTHPAEPPAGCHAFGHRGIFDDRRCDRGIRFSQRPGAGGRSADGTGGQRRRTAPPRTRRPQASLNFGAGNRRAGGPGRCEAAGHDRSRSIKGASRAGGSRISAHVRPTTGRPPPPPTQSRAKAGQQLNPLGQSPGANPRPSCADWLRVFKVPDLCPCAPFARGVRRRSWAVVAGKDLHAMPRTHQR